MTMTRTMGSASKSSRIASIPSRIPWEMALRRSGWLKVIQPMPSAFSAIIFSVLSSMAPLSPPGQRAYQSAMGLVAKSSAPAPAALMAAATAGSSRIAGARAPPA